MQLEFFSEFLLIIVTIVSFVAYDNSMAPAFNACLIVLLDYYVILFLSCALPLIYAHQFDKAFAKTRGSFPQFVSLLDSVEFRESFHTFLAKQFCQENLQFYEVIQFWKALAVGPEKLAKAQSIVTVFVIENGMCQINMTGEIRERIIKGLASSPLPDTLFDEAVESLTQDMYYNSFAQFWLYSMRDVSMAECTV